MKDEEGKPELLATEDPIEAAAEAGLRYTHDGRPGITREEIGDKEFRYRRTDGSVIEDPRTLFRIRKLAIPPAWQAVWICPSPNGHLQATGRDARGRKQYRYHPRWREIRDETKFGRMVAFGEKLPLIRARVDADMARRGLPREKVIAAVVRILDDGLVRVGNPEYEKSNDSYGATTLKDEHAAISGGRLRLRFRGKSGKMHDVRLEDRRLARIVKRSQDLPGEELFQYLDDDGVQHTIESSDINEYLRQTAGDGFTAKDFRTWAATVLVACELGGMEPAPTRKAIRSALKQTIGRAAEKLGNTVAVCRKSYVHPDVVRDFQEGRCITLPRVKSVQGLTENEAKVLAFLRSVAAG